MNYTQCRLQSGGSSQIDKATCQIAWIPSQFAISGKELRIKELGQWTPGWIVKETWQTVPESQLPDSHAERKAHKRATGDVA